MKQGFRWILSLACLLAFLSGIGAEPLAAAGLDRPGYVGLGILFLAGLLWVTEAIPLFATSFVVLLLCVVWLTPELEKAGKEIDHRIFLADFSADVIILFLGGFVLSASFKKQRLDEWLARSVLGRCGSSVPKLMLALMVTTAVLSMWVSNTATAALMLALIAPITARLPAKDRSRQGLVLSIPFAANIGGLGTPIGSPPNAIAVQYLQQEGFEASFPMWMLIGVPGVVAMLTAAWGTLLFLFPSSDTKLPLPTEKLDLPRTPSFYIVIAAAAIAVAGWLTAGLHGLSSGTVALLPIVICFGCGILGVHDVRQLPWDVLLLMGGGLCLGTAVTTSGLADWFIASMPFEQLSPFWVMTLFACVACGLSAVMSNTATASLMMPIILSLPPESHAPMLIATAFACSLSMPLPISTPPNAMAFSTEQITVNEMLRPGLPLTLFGLATLFTVGYWWWRLVGMV